MKTDETSGLRRQCWGLWWNAHLGSVVADKLVRAEDVGGDEPEAVFRPVSAHGRREGCVHESFNAVTRLKSATKGNGSTGRVKIMDKQNAPPFVVAQSTRPTPYAI